MKYMPILRRSLFQKRETPLLLIRSSAHLPRRVAGCVDCGTEGVFVQRYLGEDHRLAPGMGRSDLYNGEIPPNCSYKRLLRITPPCGAQAELLWRLSGKQPPAMLVRIESFKWRCQYHIVFAPKYRRQEIYGKLKSDIGTIL